MPKKINWKKGWLLIAVPVILVIVAIFGFVFTVSTDSCMSLEGATNFALEHEEENEIVTCSVAQTKFCSGSLERSKEITYQAKCWESGYLDIAQVPLGDWDSNVGTGTLKSTVCAVDLDCKKFDGTTEDNYPYVYGFNNMKCNDHDGDGLGHCQQYYILPEPEPTPDPDPEPEPETEPEVEPEAPESGDDQADDTGAGTRTNWYDAIIDFLSPNSDSESSDGDSVTPASDDTVVSPQPDGTGDNSSDYNWIVVGVLIVFVLVVVVIIMKRNKKNA